MQTAEAEFFTVLSILAVIFATGSALVTVLRPIRENRQTVVEVHLLATVTLAGFVACINSALPVVLGLLTLDDRALWGLSSGVAALLCAATIAGIHWERSRSSPHGLAPIDKIVFSSYWLCVVLLVIGAAVPDATGVGLYAVAASLWLATSMLSFSRQIAVSEVHKVDATVRVKVR